MKRAITVMIYAWLATGPAMAGGVTYLRCDLPADAKVGATRLDLTLDEEQGTVSFVAEGAQDASTNRAVFGPETVTWTYTSRFMSIKRTISRVDLGIVEETDIVGSTNRRTGRCVIQAPPARQF